MKPCVALFLSLRKVPPLQSSQPPLGFLPGRIPFKTATKARYAWNRALLDVSRRPSFWLLGIVIVTVLILLAREAPIPIVIFVFAPSLFATCLMCVFFRAAVRRSLRKQLNQIGVPVCVKCGYDLRGSKDRCPECGEEFGSTGVVP